MYDAVKEEFEEYRRVVESKGGVGSQNNLSSNNLGNNQKDKKKSRLGGFLGF